jgi:hypothetical protein
MKTLIFKTMVIAAGIGSVGCVDNIGKFFNGIDYFGWTAASWAALSGACPTITDLLGLT